MQWDGRADGVQQTLGTALLLSYSLHKWEGRGGGGCGTFVTWSCFRAGRYSLGTIPQSHDGHMVVTWWSHDGHMVVTWWSHDGHMVVT